MFKQMRRRDRESSSERSMEILEAADHGFLSTIAQDGYPYAVAVNHVVVDGKICFHCAMQGAKLDNIRACDKVCFSVAVNEQVIPSALSTAYDSVVAFGRAREVSGEAKMKVFAAIFAKFAPEHKGAREHVARHGAVTAIYEIEIEHMTGKSRVKLDGK